MTGWNCPGAENDGVNCSPICGDNHRVGSELCELGDLSSSICISCSGFKAGCICTGGGISTLSTCNCCGNGLEDNGEVCDFAPLSPSITGCNLDCTAVSGYDCSHPSNQGTNYCVLT